MFYDSQVERRLLYERDGELTYDEAKYGATIEAINLEHRTLKLLRKIWAQIAKTHYTKEDVKSAIDDEKLRQKILGVLRIQAADYDFLYKN